MNKIFCYFWNTRTHRTALGPCRKQSQNINFLHLTSKLKLQVDKLKMSSFKVSVTKQMMVKSYGDNRKYGWPKCKDVGGTPLKHEMFMNEGWPWDFLSCATKLIPHYIKFTSLLRLKTKCKVHITLYWKGKKKNVNIDVQYSMLHIKTRFSQPNNKQVLILISTGFVKQCSLLQEIMRSKYICWETISIKINRDATNAYSYKQKLCMYVCMYE